MSAGLAASTVTPGSTAPVVSLTSPARVACAAATRGTAATSPNNRKHLAIVRMVISWRLVASLSYQASDWTYQRQSRLRSRDIEQATCEDSRYWRRTIVRAAATESIRGVLWGHLKARPTRLSWLTRRGNQARIPVETPVRRCGLGNKARF